MTEALCRLRINEIIIKSVDREQARAWSKIDDKALVKLNVENNLQLDIYFRGEKRRLNGCHIGGQEAVLPVRGTSTVPHLYSGRRATCSGKRPGTVEKTRDRRDDQVWTHLCQILQAASESTPRCSVKGPVRRIIDRSDHGTPYWRYQSGSSRDHDSDHEMS
ncbi:hypothetical protein C8Q69DRAFT_448758 [Paecilomyces variotii]|uniref:Uncharacterized protein n=1 Tax=Byssochlamys spectabilis TaxID=264951 RepID=A0A443HH77_BYSSP|nr:hypothetical protein C8Q69DRAFT_448758 [Paecilomyces variotii]RWQ91185.1 hypothetical protein C8Q69DRAFT_448758 [Paecilomyces variotii]